MSRSVAALNERWSYASGSTYQRMSFRSTAFTGVPMPPRTPGRSLSERSADTGQRRSASARADASVVLVAGDAARIGSGAAHFFAKRAKELLDVDRSSVRNPCRIAVFGVARGHRGILAGA